MKIYKPNEVEKSSNTYDFIGSLLDNELELEQKMLKLESAFEKLTLTPGAVNKLIEELFHKFKMPLTFSRIGNHNERFDAKAQIENDFVGIIEIEVPSTSMLDAPRNQLDNIAVEANRHNIGLNHIIPIIICWTFPNNRSDYWNVINDIKKVLNIKMKTVSIMALSVCYWTRIQPEFKDDTFYVDIDNTSLMGMEDILNSKSIDPKRFEGLFQPFK